MKKELEWKGQQGIGRRGRKRVNWERVEEGKRMEGGDCSLFFRLCNQTFLKIGDLALVKEEKKRLKRKLSFHLFNTDVKHQTT